MRTHYLDVIQWALQQDWPMPVVVAYEAKNAVAASRDSTNIAAATKQSR